MSEVITYSESEAAKKIGVSAYTLYRLRRQGKIPFRRLGTCIRYTDQDIQKILEVCTVQPTYTPKKLNSKIA